MNFKTLIIAVAVLTLLSGDLYAKKVKGKMVQFHGVYSGHVLGFNEDVDDIADRCVAPKGQVVWAIASFEGWGTATQLGESYFYADHCSYRPVGGPPSGLYGQGEFYIVVAGEDVLTGTYNNGSTIPNPPMFYFTDDFRFDRNQHIFASGRGIDLGSVNFDDGTFTIQMRGKLGFKHR